MSIFNRKKRQPGVVATYTFTQAESCRGFKRVKLSSYGHKPAEDGIRALSGKDLSGKVIAVDIIKDKYPRAVFSVGKHEVGTIWDRYDCFAPLARGQIRAIRLEIADESAFLYYIE